MRRPSVLYVRAATNHRFDLTQCEPGVGTRREEWGLSAAAVVAAIQALPPSYEIRFSNEEEWPVNLIAPINAALQRRPAEV